jgi:hypothetical protein
MYWSMIVDTSSRVLDRWSIILVPTFTVIAMALFLLWSQVLHFTFASYLQIDLWGATKGILFPL